MKITKETKKLIDNSDDPYVKAVADDVGNFAALEAVYLSEGGKIILDTHIRDAIGLIHLITVDYKTLPHTELIALCADLKARLDIIRMLAHSSTNKTDAEEALQKALLES